MFGLNLIRFCPAFARPFYIRVFGSLRDKILWLKLRNYVRSSKSKKLTKGPIVIAGLFSSTSGLGRGALLMLRDFQQKNIDVVGIDLTEYFNLPPGEVPAGVLRPDEIGDLVGASLIIHLNPPEFLFTILKLQRKLWKKSKLIGYWAWETETAPKAWEKIATLVDEIWVPSPIVAMAIKKLLNSNKQEIIKVVPHATHTLPVGPRQTQALKKRLRYTHGLGDEFFIAGFSFSARSTLARKNPQAAIRAFQLAFPPDISQARFLMRAYDIALWPPGYAELQEMARNDARIILLDGLTKDIPITDFFQIIDVYVSLHRSEGYGLTMVEAADVGIPVLATDWWLPPDIAARREVIAVASHCIPVSDPQGQYDSSAGMWAEPDVNDAAEKLRTIYSTHHHERLG